MRLPSIFACPTPGFWLAIALLVALKSHHFSDFLEGLAVIIIIASAFYLLGGHISRLRLRGEKASTESAPPGGLDQRLAEVERRLTDTQDVMIALSEKMDRWEAERSSARPTTTTVEDRP